MNTKDIVKINLFLSQMQLYGNISLEHLDVPERVDLAIILSNIEEIRHKIIKKHNEKNKDTKRR